MCVWCREREREKRAMKEIREKGISMPVSGGRVFFLLYITATATAAQKRRTIERRERALTNV